MIVEQEIVPHRRIYAVQSGQCWGTIRGKLHKVLGEQKLEKAIKVEFRKHLPPSKMLNCWSN